MHPNMFSLFAALSLESVGFAVRGGGWKLVTKESIGHQGRLPGAIMSGLKARGFPRGATGVYQAVEGAQQLRGQAITNQIRGAMYGLIQSLGEAWSDCRFTHREHNRKVAIPNGIVLILLWTPNSLIFWTIIANVFKKAGNAIAFILHEHH